MEDDAPTVMNRYAQAMRDGDFATVRALYHDDFTVHYAGANPLSGPHRGIEAALIAMGEIRRRTERRMLDVVEVMTGPSRACIILREQFSRDGETHVMDRVAVYRVAGGKVAECWVYDEDQALMGSLMRD